MEYCEKVLFQDPDHPFPQTLQPHYPLPFQNGKRRVVAPEKGRGADTDLLQDLIQDPRSEGVEIKLDFGQLRHGATVLEERLKLTGGTILAGRLFFDLRGFL
jgi:hypothetical protein